MTSTTVHTKSAGETPLQRTLTSVLNDLPVDSALAAIFHRENGPLVGHAEHFCPLRESQITCVDASAIRLLNAVSVHRVI